MTLAVPYKSFCVSLDRQLLFASVRPERLRFRRALTWAEFCSDFSGRFSRADSFPIELAETFTSLAIDAGDIPFASVFDTAFPLALLNSIADCLEAGCADRLLAPYVWCVSRLTLAGASFVPFFAETGAVPLLVSIATANYVRASPHSFRALINLAPHPGARIAGFADELLEFARGRPSFAYPVGSLCLQLLALLPSDDIAAFLFDSAASAAPDQLTSLLSAICVLLRHGRHFVYRHAAFCGQLPSFLFHETRDAVLKALHIIRKLLETEELIDREMIFGLNYVLKHRIEDQVLQSLKILLIAVKRHIELETIMNVTTIVYQVVDFSQNSGYSLRIAATEFLATLVLCAGNELADYGVVGCFADVIADCGISRQVFEAIRVFKGCDDPAVMALLDGLDAVQCDSEHPNCEAARATLEFFECDDDG
jgi:hypothetical protein